MDHGEFERRYRELESLRGSVDTMNLFTDAYEGLLNEVKAMPGPKYGKFERMQRLLYQQFMFLFGEWRRAKAIDAIEGPGEETAMKGMN
jgi:hypothetical protein